MAALFNIDLARTLHGEDITSRAEKCNLMMSPYVGYWIRWISSIKCNKEVTGDIYSRYMHIYETMRPA